MISSVPHPILPPLSADEQQHSAAVAARLRETIRAAGGWLSFESFMELALYAPGLGYYSAGSAKIGASGDFVTAPEVSDLFSRCVAGQCAEVLSTTGGEILELGAGTGRMAAVVLESLAAAEVLPDRYAILEVSADLAERQRDRLRSLPARIRERVVWLDRLPERPLRGVVLANEVLDALPCRRFVVAREALAKGAPAVGPASVGLSAPAGAAIEPGTVGSRADVGPSANVGVGAVGVGPGAAVGPDAAVGPGAAIRPGPDVGSGPGVLTRDASPAVSGSGDPSSSSVGSVLELGVALDGDEFVERAAAPDGELAGACETLLRELPEPLAPGYTSEVCLRVEPWIASLGECLERGLILLFDYGLPRTHYYHPQRTTGTLRCHFKQRAHDNPYINVGVQDITAWVDFTRVAEAAVAAGLDVSGFCTQAAFLLGTGIERLVAGAHGVVEQTRRSGEARRLLMPGEMGEAFKVMALTRDYDASLGGFALRDLRHSL